MGVIPNPKMAFIFPISCILALIFPILIKYFPKGVEKGSFPKSQIKSLCAFSGLPESLYCVILRLTNHFFVIVVNLNKRCMYKVWTLHFSNTAF